MSAEDTKAGLYEVLEAWVRMWEDRLKEPAVLLRAELRRRQYRAKPSIALPETAEPIR